MVTVYGVVEYCACAYVSLRYTHVYICMCDIVSILVNDPSNVLCCVCLHVWMYTCDAYFISVDGCSASSLLTYVCRLLCIALGRKGLAGQIRQKGLAGQIRQKCLAGQIRQKGLAGQIRQKCLAGQIRQKGLAGQIRQKGLAGQIIQMV